MVEVVEQQATILNLDTQKNKQNQNNNAIRGKSMPLYSIDQFHELASHDEKLIDEYFPNDILTMSSNNPTESYNLLQIS